MGELVIETRGLRNEFRSRRGRRIVAVQGLDLSVPAGGVHGFLGPNGSGKTTTIRMLLGLARPSTGEMKLFGERVPQRLPHVMNRIGAVVEQPKFIPTFTGRLPVVQLFGDWGPPGARRRVSGVTQAPTQPTSAHPEGRKLLRLEVRNAQTPIEKKPPWIKTTAKMGPQYRELQNLVKSEGLHTVCQEAACPNIFECWEDREATFLIGGDQCTRRCDFCQIDTGKPDDLDRDEPRRVAESVHKMGLRYATITGVARDDLPDGGAWLYAETVKQIHELNPGTGVENLIPDFNGIPDLLREVFESRPEVLAHNVETVPRIFKRIRPAFRYDRSLDVITQAREFGLVTKSNLILGMGETREEVSQALRDLHDAGTELVTITQYLRPSVRHHPIERWVRPEEFVELEQEALEIGFAGVMSGPLVRSSYRAGRLYRQAIAARGQSAEVFV